jgi:hypothetical protein
MRSSHNNGAIICGVASCQQSFNTATTWYWHVRREHGNLYRSGKRKRFRKGGNYACDQFNNDCCSTYCDINSDEDSDGIGGGSGDDGNFGGSSDGNIYFGDGIVVIVAMIMMVVTVVMMISLRVVMHISEPLGDYNGKDEGSEDENGELYMLMYVINNSLDNFNLYGMHACIQAAPSTSSAL